MKKGLIYILSALLACACSMDPELTDSYSEKVAWSSESNAQLYVNKFYPLIGQDYYNDAVSNECCSDIMRMNSPMADENYFLYGTVTVSPDNNPFNNWAWGHNWALEICRFLDSMNRYGTELSEEFRCYAEAQVRWFRAHVYFEMAKRFGASVVIWRELPEMGQKDFPRCTPEECWDFIAEDLDYAATYLHETDDAGKLTKGAAYGLKARAMLYAGRYAEAEAAAKAVEDLHLYELEDDYGKLFLYTRAKGVSKESVVEYGFSYPSLSYTFDKFNCPPGEGGYAHASPTEDLVSLYAMADGRDFSWDDPEMAAHPYEGREPRFYASILYDGVQWKGRTLDMKEGSLDGISSAGGTTSTGYYMRKLFDPSQTVGFSESDLTFYYMRYAEVLLIHAEALAELNRLDDALDCLNQVRERADLPTVSASSKAEFMKLLRRERAVELAFEGHRFWDLRRWGLAKQTLNNSKRKGVKPQDDSEGQRSYTVFSADNKTIKYLDKYERFPIPLVEIQRNESMEQFEEWK
ncbi:MAG: RagB/SusD family nutrient uptake outer membrane protein [Candidatus Cryptobacteroides sp.]